MDTTSRLLLLTSLALCLPVGCDASRPADAPQAPVESSEHAEATPAEPRGLPSAVTAHSRYTGIAEQDCNEVEAADEETGMGRVVECPGVDGWRLRLVEGDARMSVEAVTPAGRVFPLEFSSVVTSAFSSLGEKAEWRFAAGGGAPQALIVRLDANEDPERPERITSYLVVSRLRSDGACVVAKTPPGAGQNEAARLAADAALAKDCLPAP